MVDCLNEYHSDEFSAYNGDCVSVLAQLPDLTKCVNAINGFKYYPNFKKQLNKKHGN